MSFENPGFFEELRMEWLWNRAGIVRYRKFVEEPDLRSDENVLDFGCGGGAVSRHIAKNIPRGKLVCLDTSKFWLRKAKKRLGSFSNVEYISSDLKDSVLPDNHFDSIFIHFVLHDIDEEQRQEVIDTLTAKLRHNGQIRIREPTRPDHGMPPSQIRQHMHAAGLSEISGTHGSYFLWPYFTGIFGKGSGRD